MNTLLEFNATFSRFKAKHYRRVLQLMFNWLALKHIFLSSRHSAVDVMQCTRYSYRSGPSLSREWDNFELSRTFPSEPIYPLLLTVL